MKMKKKSRINRLVFEPINRFFNAGNETHVVKTKVLGIEIIWYTYFPWNIFKDPTDTFVVDLTLPLDYPIKNGKISENYYTDSGYGLPVFNTIEDSYDFIKNYRNENN